MTRFADWFIPGIIFNNPLTFKKLQDEQKPWVEYNFPGREWWQPIFGVMEELGELCHALLKRKQGIRGTEKEHLDKIKDAIADATIFMADACTTLGIDYQEVMEATWAEVKQRDWVKFPKNGRSE